MDSNDHLHLKLKYSHEFSDILLNINSKHLCNKIEETFDSYFDIKTKIDYPFEYGGSSGCLILGESHATWHSFPENNLLIMDVYSCIDISSKIKDILYSISYDLKPKTIEYCYRNSENIEYKHY